MFERGGSRGWVTTEAIEWDLGRKDSGYTLYIWAGKEFESSVPWYLTWLMNPDDPRFLLAACVHDVLLEDGFRPFFSASEWYDAALKGGASKGFALLAAVFISLRGSLLWREPETT